MKVRLIRKAKKKSRHGEINVTPLIDVVLVLLIIFMVVTPLLEQQLIVDTPIAEAIDAEDLPEQLIVAIDERGALTLNDEKVDESALASVLRSRMSSGKPRVVFFIAHDDAPYANLARALGQGRAAGARLGFAVEN